MKKYIYFLPLFFSLAFSAQGRTENQGAVHLQYGYLPYMSGISNSSFLVKGGYSRIFGEKGFLGKAEAFFQKSKEPFMGEMYLDYEKYGLNVAYGWSYEKMSPFFVNGMLGAYGAFEIFNGRNEREPKYGTKISQSTRNIIFGVSFSLEAEYSFSKDFSFLAEYSQFLDLASEFSKNNYGVFAGVKFKFN